MTKKKKKIAVKSKMSEIRITGESQIVRENFFSSMLLYLLQGRRLDEVHGRVRTPHTIWYQVDYLLLIK